MRILIDLQGAQTTSRFRGIGRYSLAHTSAVIKNKKEHEVYILLNGLLAESLESIVNEFKKILPRENILIWYSPGPVMDVIGNTEGKRCIAELMRESYIQMINPDIVHITSLFEGYGDDAVTSIKNFGGNTLVSVTLYDLIPLLNPKEYLDASSVFSNHYYRKLESLKKADLLLAISNYSREEAIENLHFDQEKIVNISSAVADTFFDSSIKDPTKCSQTLEKFNIKKNFILYTGGIDPRKNLIRLLEAYSSLDEILKKEHQLVLAGIIDPIEMPALKKIISKLNIRDIVFTDYISDTEIKILYKECKLFIFPSWHEGFGLPVLEAMHCGAAVICSNTTSLPEVIGLSEATFDPYSVDSISLKIKECLTNPVLTYSLKEHGKDQVKKFSWDECARKSILAFENLFEKQKLANNQQLNTVFSESDFILKLSSLMNKHSLEGDKDLAEFSACASHNFSQPQMTNQLFVDVSELVWKDARSGIQRVVRSVLKELLSKNLDGYIVRPIYANETKTGYFYANEFTRKFLASLDTNKSNFNTLIYEENDFLIETKINDIYLGLDLKQILIWFQENYLKSLHLNGVKVFFVVYDLLPIQIPHAFPPSALNVHETWLKVISQFDGLFCISKSVEDDLINYYQKNDIKLNNNILISHFHLGSDIENSVQTTGLPDDAEFLIKQINEKISFLMVGTLEPRKDHLGTLEAFELLWSQNENLNLVIVGKQGWMVDKLVQKIEHHPQLNKKLFWLNGISDEFLEKIYSSCQCLIAASKGEGFGLPIIEAAQRNLPVFARDITVFREVAGPNAYFFKGSSTQSLADSILSWIALYKNDQHPKSNMIGYLDWQQSTQELLKLMSIQSEKNNL